MSQDKTIELGPRMRNFRNRARLSQIELGERLGVSGNYISMLELGKKDPGPSLAKLFESMEHSPLYAGGDQNAPTAGLAAILPPNPIYSMLSNETLQRNFGEVAEKLFDSTNKEKDRVVGTLREMLNEIEHRLVAKAEASSGGLSEAQHVALKAAKSGGSRGTK
jgi:transcriptional regulator with XRE-family HTH domain